MKLYPDWKALPLSAETWRQRLPADVYAVTREAGTERPFSGQHLYRDDDGHYLCTCCGHVLFDSADKFDAGCGWPSFSREHHAARIARVEDRSHGMVRVEVRCSRCDAHLGHVFPDGPLPTGERYCINSLSLDFLPQDAVKLRRS